MAPLLRRRLGVLVGIALACTLVAAAPAPAVTIEEKRAEAARLHAELERRGRDVSVAAEQFNRARFRQEEVAAAIAGAQADLQRADSRMVEARGLVAQAAVAAYVGGGPTALLSRLAGATGGDDLIVRRQYLRVTVTDHRSVVDQMRVAKEDLAVAQSRLAAEEREAAAATAAAAERQREAEVAEAAMRAVLGEVRGELAELVAAEEARRAEEDARAARAVREAAAAAAAAEAARRAAAAALAPAAAAAPQTQPAEAAGAAPASEASERGAVAVAEARKHIGKPYQWGGSGPDSFDCSGLTSWAWRAAGVSLPRTAYQQYLATTRVAQADIKLGDLLFFGPSVSGIHHVAIYAGDGQMIEASTTGTPVRFRGWRAGDLIGIGRPG